MTDVQLSLPEEFGTWVKSKSYKNMRPVLAKALSADVAEFVKDASLSDAAMILRLLPKRKRAEVFAYSSFDLQEHFLEALPEGVVTTLLNDMEPDDRTKLLENLPFELQKKFIATLSPEERTVASHLLSFEEGTIGRLMNTDVLAVKADVKISEVFDLIRWSVRSPEELHSQIFVVDAQQKLLGEIGLSHLVLADPPSMTLEHLMEPSPVFLKASDEKGVAVDVFRKYDKPSIAVVDDDQKLIGVVTSDDVFDVAEEEATEELQRFGGGARLEESYFQTPALTMLKKRTGWLSILFIGQIFTGTAMHHYDHLIESMRYLVYFIPLVISSGGNSGSQAASLIIRGLSVNEIKLADWKRIAGREAIMGLALGMILGGIGFLRVFLWTQSVPEGLVVGLALVGIVLLGCILGSLLPLLVKVCRMDPALSSSPLIASLVDVTGIVIYFNVANLVFKWIAPSFGLSVSPSGY